MPRHPGSPLLPLFPLTPRPTLAARALPVAAALALLAPASACVSDPDCGICDPDKLVLESITGINYANRRVHLLTEGVDEGKYFIEEVGACVETEAANSLVGATPATRGAEEWCKLSPLVSWQGLEFVFNNLLEPTTIELVLDPRDLEEKFTRGSGPGGQHRNKTETAVQLRHKPSGLAVRVEKGRSRADNRTMALRVLSARLLAAKQDSEDAQRSRARREQAGSGQRGDKIRTIALQRDQVVDHRSGKSCTAREYLRGHLRALLDE